MTRPRRGVVIMAVGLVLAAFPGVTQAQLVLYDDFSVSKINPAKWHGREALGGPTAPNTESLRKISAGQLQLLLTSFGGTSSDTGVSGTGSLRLRINNPGPVTTMQAAVTVKAATAQGCPANPSLTRTLAGIHAFFFNDGTSPGPGDPTGDILAGIQKVRRSNGTGRIEAFIARCPDVQCVFATTTAFHVFTTIWTPGIADTLRFQWDAANDRFLYAVNPGTAGEETVALSYSESDANSPGHTGKELRIQHTVANCTAGRKKASMIALFDDVMLNPEAVP